MKNIAFISCLCLSILISCKSSQQQETAETQKLIDSTLLNGSWELNHFPGGRLPFDSLFAMKRPVMMLDVAGKRISGNNSCNSFSGPFELKGTKILFPGPMMSTKMACPGEGEKIFMETLNQVNSFALEGTKLTFSRDGRELMRFMKK